MMINKLILSFFVSSILLLASCNTTKNNKATKQAAAPSDPPLYISSNIRNNTIYVGVPNSIKIHTPSGKTNHLKVSSIGGKLSCIDSTKGIYNFIVNRAGLSVEVVATDLVSGKKAFAVFNVLEVPAPEATIGLYRQPKSYTTITSSSIKQQNALILDFPVPLPIRCGTGSYRVIRIQPNGKRDEAVNSDPTGVFEEAVVKLIAKANKGDIYVFADIKTNCSKEKAKDIVYLLIE